jgi:hypothetical protein
MNRGFWTGGALLGAGGLLATLVSFDPARSLGPCALLGLGLALTGAIAAGRLPAAAGAVLLVVLGAGLALYFVLQNDFADRSKFALVRSLSAPFTGLLPDLGWHKPHPNIAAGGLEIALPFAVAGVAAGRGWVRLAAGGAAVLCAFALLLTESRGAWLALGLAGVGAGLAYLVRAHYRQQLARGVGPAILAALGLALIACTAGLLLTLRDPVLLRSLVQRLTLYRQAAALMGDYLFTGAGLGVFEPAYAQYILFHGAPPEPHAHDLWLDLGIAQGVGGVLGYALFTGATAAGAWRALRGSAHLPALWWAALVAWLALLVHGVGDDVHYESILLPLLIVTPALLLAAAPPREGHPTGPVPAVRGHRGRLVLAGGLLAGVLVVAAGSPLLSLAESNLGNLAQARIDLGGDRAPATAATADRWLTAAWQTWPANPSSARRAAYFYLAQHQIDRAVAYHQATGASVDDWPRMAYDLAYHQQQFAYGWAVDRAAIMQGTTNAQAYYAVARDDAMHGNWARAVAEQRRALELDPGAPADQYVALGDWLQQTADGAGALAAYRVAIRLAPDNAAAVRAIQQIGSRP